MGRPTNWSDKPPWFIKVHSEGNSHCLPCTHSQLCLFSLKRELANSTYFPTTLDGLPQRRNENLNLFTATQPPPPSLLSALMFLLVCHKAKACTSQVVLLICFCLSHLFCQLSCHQGHFPHFPPVKHAFLVWVDGGNRPVKKRISKLGQKAE